MNAAATLACGQRSVQPHLSVPLAISVAPCGDIIQVQRKRVESRRPPVIGAEGHEAHVAALVELLLVLSLVLRFWDLQHLHPVALDVKDDDVPHARQRAEALEDLS